MTGIIQDTARVEDTPNNSEASGGPSITSDGKKEQGEQGDFDDDDQCKIPMTVFWSSIQEENAAPKTDEKECDNDCETFHPTDAMSFAWQIARGMVGLFRFLFRSLGNHGCMVKVQPPVEVLILKIV